jgi:hypothetical protein
MGVRMNPDGGAANPPNKNAPTAGPGLRLEGEIVTIVAARIGRRRGPLSPAAPRAIVPSNAPRAPSDRDPQCSRLFARGLVVFRSRQRFDLLAVNDVCGQSECDTLATL